MSSGKILIVEDEVIVSTDLKRKLIKLGYEVSGCVRYAEKALEAVRSTQPDLIMMDIQLKGEKDGSWAAGEISAEFDIPIVYLSAFSDKETLEKAKAAVPYAYLKKPIRTEELASCIEITLYKAAMETKLKDSEIRFRTIADFAYDWETWVSPDGRLLYSSPSCERITGFSADDFYNDPELLYSIIISTEGEDEAEKFRCHRFDDAGPITMELAIRRADGEERWVEHICRPVYSPSGEFLGRRASNRDMTDRKADEAAREKLILELKTAMENVKTLSGLLPICSHCKKIRDDKGYWNQLEKFFNDHSDIKLSHSLCPDCAKELYPDIFQ